VQEMLGHEAGQIRASTRRLANRHASIACCPGSCRHAKPSDNPLKIVVETSLRTLNCSSRRAAYTPDPPGSFRAKQLSHATFRVVIGLCCSFDIRHPVICCLTWQAGPRRRHQELHRIRAAEEVHDAYRCKSFLELRYSQYNTVSKKRCA
jgi:hypothetical protein